MMDRRIQRTRGLLQDALFSLIVEEGYDALSVQDIVDRANLGRSTFYVHFKDKDDLLLTAMEDGYRDLKAHMSAAQPPEGFFVPLEMVFDYAAANRELFLVLLNGTGKMTFYRQARDYLAGGMVDLLKDVFPRPRIPLDFTAVFFASSLLGMVIWWLEAEMPFSSVEMVSRVRLLFREGVNALQGEHVQEARGPF